MADKRWHPVHHGFRSGPLGIASICNTCQCLVSYGGEQIHRERCPEPSGPATKEASDG